MDFSAIKPLSTPAIPDWIVNFPDVVVPPTENYPEAKWVNAFNSRHLGRSAKNLYPTETLYGDWNAEVLFLAQDALPAGALRDLIRFHEERNEPPYYAWRHADRIVYGDKSGTKTNTKLAVLKEKFIPNASALYGSSTAHMLFDEHECRRYSAVTKQTKYRQDLRGFNNPILFEHLVAVLTWVVSHMKNIRYILCLGEKAWRVSVNASSQPVLSKFAELRDAARCAQATIANTPVILIPAYHPAARVSSDVMEKNWEYLRQQMP